jgi:hypothetical protein
MTKESLYYIDFEIREEIDALLQRNAIIWANLGTGSKNDVGTMDIAVKRWTYLADQIRELDPVFYASLIINDDNINLETSTDE